MENSLPLTKKNKKGNVGISGSIDKLLEGYTYQFKAKTFAIV